MNAFGSHKGFLKNEILLCFLYECICIVFIISSQKFKPFFKILKSTKICHTPCRKCTTTGDIYLLVLNCNIIAFEITMVNAQLLVPSTLQNKLLSGCVTDNQVPTQNMYELQAISNDSALEDEEGTAAAKEERTFVWEPVMKKFFNRVYLFRR